MAKPDDRSDNVRKLQRSVQNTIENLREGEDYLEEHAGELSPQDAANVQAKNERRRAAIEGQRLEIKDEANAQE